MYFNQKHLNLFERALLSTPFSPSFIHCGWVCIKRPLFNIIQLLEIYDYNKNNNQIVWMTKWNPSDMHTTWTSASIHPSIQHLIFNRAQLSTTIELNCIFSHNVCVFWFVCVSAYHTHRIQDDASSIYYAATATATTTHFTQSKL